MLKLPHSTRRDFLGQLGGLGALMSLPPGLLAQERLPTRPIPGTGESLPIVGFGSSKSVLEIASQGSEPILNVIQSLLDHGGRVVDTSIRTTEIDEAFGREVMQVPAIQENIFLATKVNTPHAEEGIRQHEQTMRLFGRRQVDLIQVESLNGLEHHWPRLKEWKDDGQTSYIGVTVSSYRNFDPLEQFMRRESPDFIHVNYSPLESRAEERILPLAQDMGIPTIINRPFMNGTYFSRVGGQRLPDWAAEFNCHTWAQLSLKYILSNRAVTCVLTETTNPDHMIENIGAGFGGLPDEAQRRSIRQLLSNL